MDPNPFRTKVEAQLAHTPLIEVSTLSTDELLHELHVHQIELEMQNEELRRTHIALEESRDRYVNLYEFAPVGYLTLTREGLITEINLTGATLLGVDRNKLINHRFAALVAPQDGDRWHRLFRRVIQHEGKVHDYELILQRSNNVVFDALLSCLLVATDDKAPMIRITLTDITKHKKIEEALQKSQKEEAALYKSKMDLKYAQAVVHVGSWRIDAHNNILAWSDENFRIFGIPKGTPLTYQSFLDSVHPADRQLVDAAWKDALTGKSYDIEHRIIVGQKVKWVRELAELEFGEHGSLLGGFGTTEDITDIKSTQEALQHERTFLRQVIDAVPSMIFVKNREGQFLLGNAALAQCYGTSPENLTGLTDENFNLDADEVADFYQDGLDVINNCASKLIPEEKLTHADGSVHWYSTIKIPLIDDDNSCNKLLGVATEITARKLAEEALVKAGALQGAIFNSAKFSSIATDAKGVIQIFNVGAERMLGYTAAEVMNKITPAEISDPQEVIARATALSLELDTPIEPGFEALVFKASRGIEDIYELTYIRKDGSRFPAVVSVTALRDDQNTIIGYLLIGTEIKAGALQSAIFNSANFSSIATDAEGVIQIFNVGAERMLGYSAAEVMNKVTPADISDPQEVIARAKALSAELDTPIMPGFEALVFKASRGIEDIYDLTYIRKDGSRFPAVVSVTALRDAQNAIIGYLLIGTDNTARKQIEEEQKKLDQRLRDQQFYTRSLIESNIDAIMTTDLSGIISDVNKQMEVLTSCTRDELIGAPFKNNFTDPERAEASIKLVLSEKKVTNYELTARARDGKETVVSFNATTFYDRDRKLQGVFAAARDVTERKRLDQELENAKSVAEKANHAKSDFLSSMSHELRTPLNAILGFAQLLEAGSPPPTATQAVRLHQIVKAGWYLLELINEILDLALIESGKISMSSEPVALIDVILECQAMIEPQAQQHDIKLTFLPFDKTWFVSADRTRVKQVLINLLSNAIKYNREHGTVEVKCTESTPERLRISVKDSGEGLAPEKLAQLFQPFNRLGRESSGEEGTGIGLVVTKQLIELMGGTIGVESTVGVGCEFWIELIRDLTPQFFAENTPPAELALQTQENATPRTLLYVEDNPANLMLVEQIIEGHPHIHMLSARDGKQGIALAYTHLPDVILMDINLPGLSGFQALELLREDPATAHIPVVAISANAMPRDIEKGLEAGFFRYLTKPIKVNEFMDALDGALKFSETGLDDTNKKNKYDD
ncbi:PAS domain S-box protein [Methylobacter svalbardensis]|uniref:PAS domain-containing hybrid sensor histidine kinase/response regulator n=1 Tax=Methylobacter svalbardensis TaxID=3080016 RepID=UPI0030ECF774